MRRWDESGKIRALSVWVRARYLSITKAPYKTESLGVDGDEYQGRPTGLPARFGVTGGSASHYYAPGPPPQQTPNTDPKLA